VQKCLKSFSPSSAGCEGHYSPNWAPTCASAAVGSNLTPVLGSSKCACPDKPLSILAALGDGKSPPSLFLLQPAASPALPYHIMAAIMSPAKAEAAAVSITEEPRGETFDQNVEKELDEPGAIPAKYRGTAADHRDMIILGKKQVLRVCVLPNLTSSSHIHRRNDCLFVLSACAAKL
jgi:hypothetical protein